MRYGCPGLTSLWPSSDVVEPVGSDQACQAYVPGRIHVNRTLRRHDVGGGPIRVPPATCEQYLATREIQGAVQRVDRREFLAPRRCASPSQKLLDPAVRSQVFHPMWMMIGRR